MLLVDFAKSVAKGIRGDSERLVKSVGIWLVGVLPVCAFTLVLIFHLDVQAPAALLTTMALVFGGYLSAFVHYSTLRLRLAETQDSYQYAQKPERSLVDSVATLLLFGAVSAVVSATVLAIFMSLVTTPDDDSLHGLFAAFTIGLCSVPLLTFVYISPLLYRGYQQVVAESRSAVSH